MRPPETGPAPAVPQSFSVGIVTHNSAAVIAPLLDSLAAADWRGLDAEVLLRDNGSRDGTPAILAARAGRWPKTESGPRLRLLPGGDNIGFGAGHNAILARARGAIHVICNPDIVVGRDFPAACRRVLETDPAIALASPRMTDAAGYPWPAWRRHPAVLDLVLRRIGRDRLPGRWRARLDRHEMAELAGDRMSDVPFCQGALMIARRDALLGVGGFDARYFLYFEDLDLCRALQAAGWRTVYTPTPTVVHHWARGARSSPRLTAIQLVSAWRYYRKWGWRWWLPA